MSARDAQYAYSYATPKNHQQLHHQAAQTSLHHQYTQQTNQFTTTQDGLLTQTTSGTPNPQYTSPHNTPIAPNTPGTQTRRFKTPQHTSIAPQIPCTTNRQYTTSQHPSIASPALDHPTSPLNSTQCISAPNGITSLNSMSTPPSIPTGISSTGSGTTMVTNFELQDVIAQFQTQPELLKLILTSKVEEDKRKAEEAKLRVRELDLMLSERNRQRKHIEEMENSKHNGDEQANNDMDYENDHTMGAFSVSDGSLNYASFNNSLTSSVQNLTNNSSSNTPIISSTSRPKPTPHLKPTPKGSPPTSQLQLNSQNLLMTQSQASYDTEVGLNEEGNNTPNIRKRKRREMLPVTMIIETKEYPYVDDYLWKNNGNTTQRKTGNKSVYFKCSNSNKGCPVNKTVTEKDGGWTIKYRGHHLEECGKIKRIVQN
ncbi:12495_t:CDS:2 [Acaulospora morrowiae]|uniref:12495_t:CDS:1 n=1 Tax=Acaulospora morrowiae TaxID=94023 RepID=A0A9N9FMF0_9GLOM|nr:12495_t:CDS:2 [Acaulospora morrowiae]